MPGKLQPFYRNKMNVNLRMAGCKFFTKKCYYLKSRQERKDGIPLHHMFEYPVVSSTPFIFLMCGLNSAFQVLYQNSSHLKPPALKKPLAIIKN